MTWLSAGLFADTQAPTTPTNLAASNTTDSSTDLSWTASSDDESVAGYYVYQDGTQIQDVSGASTSTTVSGLSGDTTYSFAVSAYDAAGNESAQSASVQVTTEATVPQNGLQVHYLMNSTHATSGSITDQSGNNDPLIINGASIGTEYTTFDGTDDYGLRTTIDVNGTEFAVALRFRFPSVESYGRIIQAGGSRSDRPVDGWECTFSGSGSQLEVANRENDSGGNMGTTASLSSNAWYRAIVQGSGDTTSIHVYDDGGSTLDTTNFTDGRGTTANHDLYVMVGDGKYQPSDMSFLTAYNRTLTQSERQEFANL